MRETIEKMSLKELEYLNEYIAILIKKREQEKKEGVIDTLYDKIKEIQNILNQYDMELYDCDNNIIDLDDISYIQ